MSEKTRFTPIRGAEEVILNYSFNDGYVYFATDTKRMFMDALIKDPNDPNNTVEKNKMPIGSATSGIYYGVRPLTEDEQTSSRIIF